ncbi:MAG: hypothetical protein OXI15_02215 [Chromatiales bacterium]|nr:hypothetical protein [Chromatiales bacterium]
MTTKPRTGRQRRQVLTRPEALRRHMDRAAAGITDESSRQLARALAVIEYEDAEDKRVFGFVTRPPQQPYLNLRRTAEAIVDRSKQPSGHRSGPSGGTTIAFRRLKGEVTAVFEGTASAGRISCFSCRDGHFAAGIQDAEAWPPDEPTGQLLLELADNFWPVIPRAGEQSAARNESK